MLGNKNTANLYSAGAQTEGVVMHRADTTEGIHYRVTIRAKLPDGSTTQFKKWLDRHDVGQLYQGSVVPVRYDAADLSEVALDLPALQERHAQADGGRNGQLDTRSERLAEPRSGAGHGPGLPALARLGNLRDLTAQLRQMAAQNPRSLVDPSSVGSSGPPGSYPEDRLAKLADLKERGVLSSEEFAAQKAKILGES